MASGIFQFIGTAAKVSHRDSKRRSNSLESRPGWVGMTALNDTQGRRSDSGVVRYGFLRQSLLFAQLPDCFT
jgi:hypothetical protein